MGGMRRSHRGASALVLASILVTAACSGDDEEWTTTSAPAPTATETPGTAPAVTEPPATAAPATDPPATDPPAATAPTVPASEPLVFDFAEVDALVDEFLAEQGLNGVGLAVVHEEYGVVHERYWGEFDADRVSLVASSSKMVSAGVLARLADDGLLDLDAPVAENLDGIADWGAGNPEITPAQLVSNSSGLVGLLQDPGYGPYVCQFLPGGTLQDCGAQIFTTPDDDADVIPPDTEYRYGGGQWQVAGALAEAVSGRSWAELVEEIYVEPCGLETLGYNNHFTQLGPGGFAYPTDFDGDPSILAPTDNPNLEGGMYTNVRDYAALLLMHLRDGWCGENRVLSTEALARLHADRTGEVYGSDTGYGMGWWVDRATGRLTDPGAYGAVAWLDLADGHGGFLVIEADAGTGSAFAATLYEPVADAIAAAEG
jgi:CubicO group peptidase (beta-lactamase class C family)